MGEAAIRIRLLYELDRSREAGATIREMGEHYNEEKILYPFRSPCHNKKPRIQSND